jgi:hypothetical protein
LYGINKYQTERRRKKKWKGMNGKKR